MCSTGREEKLQVMQDVQKMLKSNFAQMHPLSTGDIERAETGGERWCVQAGQPQKTLPKTCDVLRQRREASLSRLWAEGSPRGTPSAGDMREPK
jgi:hypothetical protein